MLRNWTLNRQKKDLTHETDLTKEEDLIQQKDTNLEMNFTEI